jgi:hypothetical protein
MADRTLGPWVVGRPPGGLRESTRHELRTSRGEIVAAIWEGPRSSLWEVFDGGTSSGSGFEDSLEAAKARAAVVLYAAGWHLEQAAPTAQSDALGQLAAFYEQCGPRARSVLLSLAERIARGATEYGDDFERPADWRKEAQAERLDALVYQTIELELGGVTRG